MRDQAMFGTAQLPKFRDDQFAALGLAEVEDRVAKVNETLSWIKQTSETEGGATALALAKLPDAEPLRLTISG